MLRLSKKLHQDIEVLQVATPLLVPLVENDGTRWAKPILEHYLAPLQEANIDTLVLGCTHYPFFKSDIQAILGTSVAVISQDEILPKKVASFLAQHPELEKRLSKGGTVSYRVTDINDSFKRIAQHILGFEASLTKAHIAKDS